MIYLTYSDLLHIGHRILGEDIPIRDIGLLESALARPRASVLGADAYASLGEKAAALTHSLVKNHALIDGNKRLGLATLIAFLGINGRRLTWSNDDAYEFIMDIADGRLDEVKDISSRIMFGSQTR